jgi:hypothetical protein
MKKILSLCAFVLAVFAGSPLLAKGEIHSFGFPGTTAHFVIATPPGWKEITFNNPVDFKFATLDGKIEGYLQLIYYKTRVGKNELGNDLFEIIESVYEKDIHLKQDRYEIIFFEANNEFASCIFRYTHGSHSEQVVAFAFKAYDGKATGTMSVLIKGHGIKDDFDQEFSAVESIVENIAFLE